MSKKITLFDYLELTKDGEEITTEREATQEEIAIYKNHIKSMKKIDSI